ncbi:MAG: hypothetical protein WC897_00475 [Candidatus Gracilibacteria bacterium]
MKQRPDQVHITVKDLLRLGDAQMRNPRAETGALLLGGIMNGTVFDVKECIGLGLGDNPETARFEVGDQTKANIEEELRLNSHTPNWSMAHTHGPYLGADANGPSSADIRYTGQLENQISNYGVSLVIKTNADGSGRLTFFDGQGREIPWVVTGLDGRERTQADVRTNGWGSAWDRDAHGCSSTQHFTRERASNNNRAFERAVA